ncbi:acyl-CoA/acyl-ACP dehydrogenase [Rhodococcus sp. T2V]|uniref:acyl-CoA dehydrogenase family protein n=1 Tax=Rhodococcus sp. T2V TaxID=3034164 RepID=UPI0023E2F095|nr:acyl-CoA dehydrogenase family protein [Rhodococcus sp. T2V]MDF3310065.1 acyl-CoA/acyl-ACP dehydrogenase [Rhodococcus sp. T2V]
MTTDSSDREFLAETTGRVVSAHAPLGNLEKVVQADPGHDPEMWQRLVQLGASALLAPEELGGLGQTLAEATVVAIELGRAAVPGPFLSSAVAATSLLAALPAGPARDGLLERLAAGAVTAAVVDATRASVKMAEEGTVWRIDGEATFVLGADSADVLVVHGADIVLVVEAVDAQRTPTPMSDQTRRMATVTFGGVEVGEDAVVATGEVVGAAVERARLEFELAVAADAVGGAEAVLAIAVEYAKTREQFDRPIGSFQAIKHKLADMHVLVESAKAIVAEAADAWVAAGADGAVPEVITRAAVAYATAAYVSVAGDAIQVHGGIGFTWEHPCHRFFKRSWLNQALVEGPARARALFADAIIDRALSAG